jgi:hypothetical protein
VRTHERGGLALPGTVFLPNSRKTAYVRASFSLLEEAEVEQPFRRPADMVHEARAWCTYEAMHPNVPTICVYCLREGVHHVLPFALSSRVRRVFAFTLLQ